MARGRTPKSKAIEALATQQVLNFSSPEAEPTIVTIPPVRKDSYTVTEVTQLLEGAIANHTVLGGAVIVQGELSNVKRSSRGHVYFTLKDETASIGGILWASTANRLTFQMADGLSVYLTGRLEVYRPSGAYSIVGSRIEPVGIGPLQLAFEQIKARLDAEGLFMEAYKKPIPFFPNRIGIITSSTGAVIHDMLRVIRRKNPVVDVLLRSVKVQGEGAALAIADAIRELNDPLYNLDLLIIARGGGSFEDLFCFSEEIAVRAVFESRLPIIAGVGHEPDYSLCDAAADYSAATPTAAAEHAVPDVFLLREQLAAQSHELMKQMREALLYYEQSLDRDATWLIDFHQNTLEAWRKTIVGQSDNLLSAFRLAFQREEQRLGEAASVLDALNPVKTLARGYGIVTDAWETVVSSIGQVSPGDALSLRLSDGRIGCHVTHIAPVVPEDFPQTPQ